MEEKKYQVIVTGGGMAGICAAIASARGGARTALIQDRPVLGGNASSEIRMHITGATDHGHRENARETGILEELLLENRARNPQHSFSIFDTVLWEKVREEKNIDLYLNTRVTDVETGDNKIRALLAQQLTSEKDFRFVGKIYVDCTGDGMIAARAGAHVRRGMEGRDEFDEPHAPEHGINGTMGNSILFKAENTGAPVPFTRPDWAYEFTEEDLFYRPHGNASHNDNNFDIESGFWWIELGGDKDTIADAEEIRDELLKILYGVWDHIKNKGAHGAENYVLDWVQFLPGKRESRRIEGEYLLKEQDVAEGRIFDDAVAYGGWPMDMHPPKGFWFSGAPTDYVTVPKLYTIPYRCYYSRNVSNLMMAGRNISTTHMAFGSTRVMGTCAVGGQAVGTAAAMAVQKNCDPADIGKRCIRELQFQLMKDDCYLPGYVYHDDKNIVEKAVSISSSSWQGEGSPEKIRDGHQRNENGEIHEWTSEPIKGEPEWLDIQLNGPHKISELHIIFDTDLTTEIQISLSGAVRASQIPGMPLSLAKHYRVQLIEKDKVIWEKEQKENHRRFVSLSPMKEADKIRIEIIENWGDGCAKIFEVRAYENDTV